MKPPRPARRRYERPSARPWPASVPKWSCHDHRRSFARPHPTGRALADWHESGAAAPPGRELTAFGPGDVAWSAYYDNVVGRLGFHDPLDDGAGGPLGYLVCGWYANAALDPLADPAITSLSAFYARLADLGWSLPVGELEQDVLAMPFDVGPPSETLAALVAGAGPHPLVTDGSWW